MTPQSRPFQARQPSWIVNVSSPSATSASLSVSRSSGKVECFISPLSCPHNVCQLSRKGQCQPQGSHHRSSRGRWQRTLQQALVGSNCEFDSPFARHNHAGSPSAVLPLSSESSVHITTDLAGDIRDEERPVDRQHAMWVCLSRDGFPDGQRPIVVSAEGRRVPLTSIVCLEREYRSSASEFPTNCTLPFPGMRLQTREHCLAR